MILSGRERREVTTARPCALCNGEAKERVDPEPAREIDVRERVESRRACLRTVRGNGVNAIFRGCHSV